MQRALAELPMRRAPASLERRVIGAIEARAGHAPGENGELSRAGSASRKRLPRGGFAAWPILTRAALIACCIASAIVVVLGLKELAIELAALPADPSIAGRLHALREAVDLAAGFGALLVRLARMIPPAWLLSGLLATALVYGMMFALVAIGYSTLYTTPERSRS